MSLKEPFGRVHTEVNNLPGESEEGTTVEIGRAPAKSGKQRLKSKKGGKREKLSSGYFDI